MSPSTPERSAHEKETLIFPTTEAAQAFRERVGEQLAQPQPAGVDRQRDVVAEAVAAEFEQHGEAAATLREPWTHTPAEHEEVQQLVNVAFAKDLGAALAAARHSPHYPRNVDLLHDVLTGEMYELLREGGLNKQPLFGWALVLFTLVLLLVAGILLALIMV